MSLDSVGVTRVWNLRLVRPNYGGDPDGHGLATLFKETRCIVSESWCLFISFSLPERTKKKKKKAEKLGRLKPPQPPRVRRPCRALIFFSFESSWKNMKNDTTFIYLLFIYFVKQGCTTRCTQLPPSFPTIPQQCHEVLFWNSFRQTCPSSVKQTTKTIIGNRLVESRFRWSVWWCVPKCRVKWCVLCILEEKLNSVQLPTTVTVDTRFAISNLNCLPCFPLNDMLHPIAGRYPIAVTLPIAVTFSIIHMKMIVSELFSYSRQWWSLFYTSL